MELAQAFVIALLLLLVAGQFALIFTLLRRHGRTLLDLEHLDDRLAGVERTLDELADWLFATTMTPGETRRCAADAPPDAAEPAPDGIPLAVPHDDASAPTPTPTLVAASVTTVQMDRLVRRWRQEALAPAVLPSAPPVPSDPHQTGAAPAEGEPPPIVLHTRRGDQRIVPNGELAPVRLDDAPEAGLFAVYDWAARRIVWQRGWGPMLVEPSGYCFDDGSLYLADSAGGGILRIDLSGEPGRVLNRLSHPSFNDLHSVERTRRGLLVTSTGVDAILEVDLDGNLLYEWWAGEHGYTRTISGHERPAGRGHEHRDQHYHSRYHTTHVNEATFRDPDERFLLAVLFAQGEVVQIDRSLPPAEQRPEMLLGGLSCPHGLRRTPSGWLVTSSRAGEIVLLDEAFRVTDRIAYASTWVHDCVMLESGRLLLNDAQAHRLVELGGPPWRVVAVTPYPNSWRLARLREVPAAYRAWFQPTVG